MNQLLNAIAKQNDLIAKAEMGGDRANDFRDVRNNLLDELATLVRIEVRERDDGTVLVMSEGNELVNRGYVATIGLKYTSSDYNFVEPVITTSRTILAADANPDSFRYLFNYYDAIDTLKQNDTGKIKALMTSRGLYPANYASIDKHIPTGYTGVHPIPRTAFTSGATVEENDALFAAYRRDYFNFNDCMIPRLMRNLDTLVNSVVTMINNAVAPPTNNQTDANAPYDLNGNQSFMAVFTRKHPPYSGRYDNVTGDYIPEDLNIYHSLYTIGNIQVNPALLQAGGLTLLSLSATGDLENTQVILDLMERWKEGFITIDNKLPMNIDDMYRYMVTDMATESEGAMSQAMNFVDLAIQANNERMKLSGVSLDEELKNMMIFQHAYTASARMLQVMDDMLDRVINGLVRR
jgi:flagellar hook-associated protein 1 FlgK